LTARHASPQHDAWDHLLTALVFSVERLDHRRELGAPASGHQDKSSTKQRIDRGGEDWVRFAKKLRRLSHRLCFGGFPTAHTWSATVLVDEFQARGDLSQSRFRYLFRCG
jgi:hypothetical protein